MRDPARIVNRSLDAIGKSDRTIGTIFDGTMVSEAARRIYGETLRQLLRTANWAFCRKRSSLQLLGDSTGQTTTVSSFVDPPWRYAYAWPVDCVRPRWLPWGNLNPSQLAPIPGNINLPGALGTPVMSNLNSFQPWVFPYERPARFLVTASDQYPTQVGAPVDWNSLPELDGIEGVGLVNRKIILTNVQNAQLVYSYLALEIELWDELFSQAMVAVVASLLAMPLIEDKKLAVAERNNQINIAKDAIRTARVASAQEAGYPQKVDIIPDWIRMRRAGPALWNFYGLGEGAGPGITYMGWDGFSFADGSVF